MPISRLKIINDPYASLTWTTSIAVLGLEKLSKEKEIKESEIEALKTVAEQLDIFSAVSEIRLGSPEESVESVIEPRLTNSFFALRAIKGRQSTSPIKAPQFKKAGEEIRIILECYINSKSLLDIDPKILENAQDICLELLEHLNNQHSSSIGR